MRRGQRTLLARVRARGHQGVSGCGAAAGFQLRRLQEGLEPTDWKPLRTVGSGVREIRIQVGTAHRIFYVARFAEAIYVLHAFEKRSRTTAQRDLNLGRERYRDLLAMRGKEGGHGKGQD